MTATCSGTNVELCKSLGADGVIDYRTQNVVETLTRSGKQYDPIADNVFPDAGLYWSCQKYLKPSVRFVTISTGPSFSTLRTVLMILLWSARFGGGQRQFQLAGRRSSAEAAQRVAHWVRDGTLTPVIKGCMSSMSYVSFRKAEFGTHARQVGCEGCSVAAQAALEHDAR